MEEKATLIESLFERAETYLKIILDLYKLKAVNKSADAISTIVYKLIFFTVVVLVVVLLNCGLALWIGELLGKLYYGFFIVAAFYVLIAFIFYFTRGLIKSSVNDSLILKMLNKSKYDKDFTQ